MIKKTSKIIVALSISLMVFGLPLVAPVAAGQDPSARSALGSRIERQHMAPSRLEERALILVAERYSLDTGKLQVVSSNRPNFPLTGAIAYQVMVVDQQNQEPYSITLDESGKELNLEKLHEEERAAYMARYGRFEPKLAECLKAAAPHDLIPVAIEPRFPPDHPDRPKYPYVNKENWDRLPDEEKERIRKAEEEYERRLDKYLKLRSRQASQPIVERLAPMGYDAQADKLNGTIRVALTPAVIKMVAEWNDVRDLSVDPRAVTREKGRPE